MHLGDRGGAGGRVAVPEAVQRAGQTGRLGEAELRGVVAGRVHPGEGRTGEHERQFEDPAEPVGGGR